MSHFGDYMDGVPVKISEKYKRPPRIELPYSVYECPRSAQCAVDNVEYCSTLEKNVLSKLKELRNAKETKKNERRHRLQLLEEAKQNKLDAIAAAEAEERLKQLSVSEVSYPSTDEISAISPDEKVEIDDAITPQISPELHEEAMINEIVYPPNEPQQQLNILQPIPAQANYQTNNLLDDPDPLYELKMNMRIKKVPQLSNVEMMTFKDFENDTSSPFDNVELKTINDMELLAQVLQSQKQSSTSCGPLQPIIPEQNYIGIPNCASQAQVEGLSYVPNTYAEQPVHGPGIMYSPPQGYPNGYYMLTENTCDNAMPVENVNMYMPNYQYYVPANQYPVPDPNYYCNQLPINSESNNVPNDSTYIPHPYYFHYQHMPQYTTSDAVYDTSTVMHEQSMETPAPSASLNTIKSRSRSVPDIIKELNEEVESAKLRSNDRSYNASPAPKPSNPSSSKEKKELRKTKEIKTVQVINPYDDLSQNLQIMCQRIHTMGFPIERVARVCKYVGDNDKKVIECLLILGELIDLGFPEDRASDALAKHEYNRDKALDELVS